MKDIRQINFSESEIGESPINNAVLEIANCLATATLNGEQVFESAFEGNLTTADIITKVMNGVCCRIFRLKTQNTTHVQPNFNFRKQVNLLIVPFFELQVQDGVSEAVDTYRENLKRFTQKALENPSLTGNREDLNPTVQLWNFGDQSQEIEAEQNHYMEYEKVVALKAPWYSCPFYKIIFVDVR